MDVIRTHIGAPTLQHVVRGEIASGLWRVARQESAGPHTSLMSFRLVYNARGFEDAVTCDKVNQVVAIQLGQCRCSVCFWLGHKRTITWTFFRSKQSLKVGKTGNTTEIHCNGTSEVLDRSAAVGNVVVARATRPDASRVA